MTKNSYTINEFCEMHSISRSMFYKLQKIGQAPAFIKVGRRTLITQSAIQSWLENMGGVAS